MNSKGVDQMKSKWCRQCKFFSKIRNPVASCTSVPYLPYPSLPSLIDQVYITHRVKHNFSGNWLTIQKHSDFAGYNYSVIVVCRIPIQVKEILQLIKNTLGSLMWCLSPKLSLHNHNPSPLLISVHLQGSCQQEEQPMFQMCPQKFR